MRKSILLTLATVVSLALIGVNASCVESRVTLERVFQIFEVEQNAIDKGDDIQIGRKACLELHAFSASDYDASKVYSLASKRYTGDRLEAFYAFFENLDGCRP